MYDYPLNPDWSVDEIIDVMALYNAVEKAYEGGVSKAEFIKAYQRFVEIVNAKSEQKQIDREFQRVSHYSLYKVYKESLKEVDYIRL